MTADASELSVVADSFYDSLVFCPELGVHQASLSPSEPSLMLSQALGLTLYLSKYELQNETYDLNDCNVTTIH